MKIDMFICLDDYNLDKLKFKMILEYNDVFDIVWDGLDFIVNWSIFYLIY